MKKSELKSIIKECGLLSNLVAEVAFGITRAQTQLISENSAATTQRSDPRAEQEKEEQRKKKLLETKKRMLNAIGSDKMSGIFEGTKPLRNTGDNNPHSPLSGTDPTDAGVDITNLFNLAGDKWKHLK